MSNNNDIIKKISISLQYIEDNLDKSLDLRTLAGIAGISKYHFHRIFKSYTGETVQEYIRRLRLEKAAANIKYSRKDITKIAINSGYSTLANFGKAFKKYFGISSKSYRSKGVYLSNLSANRQAGLKSTKIKIMKPTIKNLEPQTVIYAREVGKYSNSAEKAWNKVCGFAGPKGLMSKDTKFIGISMDDPHVTDEGKLRYDACLTIPDGQPVETNDEVGMKTVEGGRYAVFTHKGPYEKFQETYDSIFKKWLPESGEELDERPSYELYLNSPQDTKPADLMTEIYVPVK